MDKRRILVLKSQGIEQFVGAEPAFSAIRAAHRGDAIDLMTSHELGRLAKGAPFFDRVLARHAFEDNAARQRFSRQLKKMKYHRVYDLDGSRETLALRKKIGGFAGAQWIGPKHLGRLHRGRRQNRVAMAEFPTLSPRAMHKLLNEQGLDVASRAPDISWALSMRKDSANMRPGWYGVSGPYALILPADTGAAGWSADHHAVFAIKLIESGVTPVLIGDKMHSDLGQEIGTLIVREGPRGGARALVDLINKTDLAQMAALAASADFFVAGPAEELSLVASLGCPGILMISSHETAGADAVRGRRVVRVHGDDISTYHPDDAVRLLRSMGLIGRPGDARP